MDISLKEKKKEKGYHIRNFDPEARRLARAAAAMDDMDIGTWISRAVKEKFARDMNKRGGLEYESRDSTAGHFPIDH